jgi:2-polyprenyl-6-methoxyphenol hydroxylase-like FAD-dependent oxidoreductase
MACVSKALIIGGGIAGLSAAIALSRVGVTCDVVELTGSPLGASLGVSGRAAEALDELGVYERCYETSRPFSPDSTVASQHDAAGNLISAGPQRPQWPGAKIGLGVYRPDFLQVLADEAERLGASIRIGFTAKTIDEHANGAKVAFTNGEEGLYDLVVGADGINSRTRDMLFPDAMKPEYTGQLSIRWMAPGPFVEGEGWYLGPVGRLGFYYIPQGEVYVPAVIAMPELKRMTDEEVRELFTRLLDSYTAGPVVELRKRLTPDAKLIGRPFEWILLPEPWHKGRALLIGDAAHATSAHMGQGGGMALEDSAVLGQCIAAAASLPEAFDAFMARRFERVRAVVETSVGLSRLEQAHAPPSENVALLTRALSALAQPY